MCAMLNLKLSRQSERETRKGKRREESVLARERREENAREEQAREENESTSFCKKREEQAREANAKIRLARRERREERAYVENGTNLFRQFSMRAPRDHHHVLFCSDASLEHLGRVFGCGRVKSGLARQLGVGLRVVVSDIRAR